MAYVVILRHQIPTEEKNQQGIFGICSLKIPTESVEISLEAKYKLTNKSIFISYMVFKDSTSTHSSPPFSSKYTQGLQITTGNGFVCNFLLWPYKYTFYLDFWLCACALSTLTTIFCSSIKKARLILRIKAKTQFRHNVLALQHTSVSSMTVSSFSYTCNPSEVKVTREAVVDTLSTLS